MKIMTTMENAVINLTGCNRMTANLIVNVILDLNNEAEKIENEDLEFTNIKNANRIIEQLRNDLNGARE